MTRINVVPVGELHNKHLLAEYRELPRVFTLSKKADWSMYHKWPKEYVLGTGHVKFFYDKLSFLVERYTSLNSELRKRGYNTKPIPVEELLDGTVDKRAYNKYIPTQQAVELNRQRINQRLREMNKHE